MDDAEFYLKIEEYLGASQVIHECEQELAGWNKTKKELPPTEVSTSLTELKTNLEAHEILNANLEQVRKDAEARKAAAWKKIKEIPVELSQHLPQDKWVKHKDRAVCLKLDTGSYGGDYHHTEMGVDVHGRPWVRYGGRSSIPTYILVFKEWSDILAKTPQGLERTRRQMIREGVITTSVLGVLDLTIMGLLAAGILLSGWWVAICGVLSFAVFIGFMYTRDVMEGSMFNND